jgi:hypothetical protein
MTLLFVVMTVGVMVAEQQTHPALAAMNVVDQAAALCSQVATWKARKLALVSVHLHCLSL